MQYLRKESLYNLKQIILACCTVHFAHNEHSNNVGCYNIIRSTFGCYAIYLVSYVIVKLFRFKGHELLYHYSFMSRSDQPIIREKGSQAIFGKQNINTYDILFVYIQGIS